MIKRKIDIERLSDVVFYNDLNISQIRRAFVNVQLSKYLYRYMYRDDYKMQNKQTPEMEIKPNVRYHYKPVVSKVQLRPKNWNSNPFKNESRQKYRFR